MIAAATKALRAEAVLHSPAEVPVMRRSVALLVLTMLELLLSLEAAGWSPAAAARECGASVPHDG